MVTVRRFLGAALLGSGRSKRQMADSSLPIDLLSTTVLLPEQDWTAALPVVENGPPFPRPLPK